MTDELPEGADPIDIGDFEAQLSEKRLEEQVQQAEIIDVEARETPEADHTDAALVVEYETVSGFRATDWLPMPDRYDTQMSDLAAVIEFTDSDTGDLTTLEGKRLPFRDGEPLYGVIRDVLAQEEAAVGDWGYEKRLEKASAEVSR